jgi:hypothetical protein
MTEQKNDGDWEAVRTWYKKALDEVVKEMLRIGAVAGVAVEASPVWTSPYEILIAKVWDVHQKSQFIWTISGDSVITDHVAGSVAVTPQEVARHFSLKWQMDANRLTALAQDKSPVENTETHMEAYTEKLIQYAELLYELTTRDEMWKQKFH